MLAASDVLYAFRTGTDDELPIDELSELVGRTQFPIHLDVIVAILAKRGEVVLWLHAIEHTMRVFKDPDPLRVFIELYFTPERRAAAHPDVQPRLETMEMFCKARLAYRCTSSDERKAALESIPGSVGDHMNLLPQSCTQGNLQRR